MTFRTAAISALALALGLELIGPAEADEWSGAHLTFGLAGSAADLRSATEQGIFGAEDRDVGPYVAAGYDWDFGDFSLGLVADVQMTKADDLLILGGKGLFNESDWIASFRGRVGMAVNDDLHLFASAGVAMMRLHSTLIMAAGGMENQVAQGVAAGLGMEYKLAPGRHLTLEFLHADFGATTFYDDGISVDPSADTLRVGYTFRF